MRVISHVTLRRAAPNLPATRVLFAVPKKREASVHPPQIIQYARNFACLNERLIMVCSTHQAWISASRPLNTASNVSQKDCIRLLFHPM